MNYRIMLNRSENWSMENAHQHDLVEMTLVLNDGGSFFLQDTVYPLKKGALIIMQENTLHRSISTGSTYERYVLHVPRETLVDASESKTDFSSAFNKTHCFYLDDENFKTLRELMEKCEERDEKFGDDVLRRCAFLTLLVFVARLLPDSSAVSVAGRGTSSAVRLALDYINLHLDEELPLSEIAANCFVSKYHLCRMFKEETGFTVGEYVLQRRILKASALLRKGESVQRAGDAVGFRNYNHFIRSFSRFMGISPGKYRMQKKSE